MQKSAGKGNTSIKLPKIWAPKWNIHYSNVIVFCEQIQCKYNDDDDYDDVNIQKYLVEINPECQTHLLRSCTQFSHHVVQIYYFIHFTFIWYPNLPQGQNKWNQIKITQNWSFSSIFPLKNLLFMLYPNFTWFAVVSLFGISSSIGKHTNVCDFVFVLHSFLS